LGGHVLEKILQVFSIVLEKYDDLKKFHLSKLLGFSLFPQISRVGQRLGKMWQQDFKKFHIVKIDTFSQNYFEMVTEQNIPQVFSSVLEKYEQRISKVRYRQN
jgi:hypothetical protein